MCSRSSMRRTLALLSLLIAAGCTAKATLPVVEAPPQPVAAAQVPAAGVGAVRVGVRWPAYQAQAIPYSAAALEVALLSGSTPVATASIVRPASSVTLSSLPAGTYTVQLEARRDDEAKTVVADASASIMVVANRIAAASLVLTPKFAPRLDYISPTSGPPGTPIGLYGANLWSGSTGTVSVLVDGLPVPDAMFDAGSTIYLYDLPSWAGNSASISVVVDGIGIPESQVKVFTRQVIHHLKLAPSSVTLATYQQQTFTATAYADAGETTPVSGVAFDWSLTDLVPAPTGAAGNNGFTLSGGVFRATATGSATVRVQSGDKFATASVVVDQIGTEPTPGPGGGGAP